MPNTLRVSGLPTYMSDVKRAAGLLIAAGCDKEATSYTLTAAQFTATGLSLGALSLLLTTGLPQTSTQKGIVHSYAQSKSDGSVGLTLNYDLVP
jgi:hypothetical protein